jgi:16S rRNA (cytosine1402-N4)-methyltransferase
MNAAMNLSDVPHSSVLLEEVVLALSPAEGDVIVDATFGAGGYSRRFLETADCTVHGFDRDPSVAPYAESLARDFPGRFIWHRAPFSAMQRVLNEMGVGLVQGVVMDLGVSSMQLDQAERGFSMMRDGPLDMRMDPDLKRSAWHWVHETEEHTLADLIYRYGDERASRKVAAAIVSARRLGTIDRTRQLADIVRSVVRSKPGAIDPATKTFQALRIVVNDEIGELEEGLMAATAITAPGARVVTVSFHALEDRCVKHFLQAHSRKKVARSKYDRSEPELGSSDWWVPAGTKAVMPGRAEVLRNPRSRSAKMRSAVRTAVPYVSGDGNSMLWSGKEGDA